MMCQFVLSTAVLQEERCKLKRILQAIFFWHVWVQFFANMVFGILGQMRVSNSNESAFRLNDKVGALEPVRRR